MDPLSSLKQRSLGVYSDLLEFQREKYQLWATLLDPKHLKGPFFIHVWGLFFQGFGFFLKTSKNNGIITALTTRGNEEGREEDTLRQTEREREREGSERESNECSK